MVSSQSVDFVQVFLRRILIFFLLRRTKKMGLTEMGERKRDKRDRDRILPNMDLSSFHLPETIKRNQLSKANDQPSEREKPLQSYGSVDQQQDGSTIVFCEVTVTINEKTILKRVSGMASAGELLAIMGPSGAGKSTLLSVMAGRNPLTSGCVTLNGQPVKKNMRREISYVLQTDCFYPILTLREMLTFVSLLRLPDSTPYKLKMRRMLEVVETLELNGCLDTKMGSGVNVLQGGLSGGERKRASIACELVSNPRLLLIDEPTSGLDSAIAHDLMSSLARLATQQRKTIVTSIHQPSSQIFQMFSKVLLLVKGEVAYFGPSDKMTDFVTDIGSSFDPLLNPADFVMEKIKSDPEMLRKMVDLSFAARTQEDWPRELRECLAHLSPGFSSKKDLKKTKVGSNDVTGDTKWPTGFWTQYTTLTRRSFILSKDRFMSLLNFVHVVNMLVIGMEWFQIPRTESTMNDRIGLLFFINIITEMSRCMTSQFLIYDMWGVFETEKSADFYHLSAYYLGTVTAEAPFLLVLGVWYATTSYWATGLSPTVSCFFCFLLLLILGMFIAQGLGILISVAVFRRDFATSITSTVIITLIISAGFYNAHAHVWFDWIRYVSFVSRIFSSMVEIEFAYGDEFQCNPGNSSSFPKYCTNGSTFPGSAFLSTNKITDVPIHWNVVILCCNLFLFHIASYLILRFVKQRPRC